MGGDLQESLDFLVRHGYIVLFAAVFAQQVGVPLPAVPFLLAAGALARMGQMNLFIAVSLALAAALVTDLLFYEIGRRKGGQVLGWLCRISLEPDTCVRKTEMMFSRHGSRSLLAAKFIPGLNIAAPPLAAVLKMGFGRFLLYDLLGSLLWVLTFVGLGYGFSSQIERAAAQAARLGWLLGGILGIALGGYVLWKYRQRRRLLGELKINLVSPEDLKRRMDAGEPVTVVDLRHSVEVGAEARTIPGAMLLPAEDLEARIGEIPRDRATVLVCT
jgi:membrane protein DedA with SNARE-associated domain